MLIVAQCVGLVQIYVNNEISYFTYRWLFHGLDQHWGCSGLRTRTINIELMRSVDELQIQTNIKSSLACICSHSSHANSTMLPMRTNNSTPVSGKKNNNLLHPNIKWLTWTWRQTKQRRENETANLCVIYLPCWFVRRLFASLQTLASSSAECERPHREHGSNTLS